MKLHQSKSQQTLWHRILGHLFKLLLTSQQEVGWVKRSETIRAKMAESCASTQPTQAARPH